MPFSVRTHIVLISFILAAPASAQTSVEPKRDDAAALQEKFLEERKAAIAQFPAESLARADELAQRGEAALKSGEKKAAARYFRDARWQVPFLPSNLPEHVVRVFGESRMRHSDRVNALAYSADGSKLASASRDSTVKIWDLGTGRDLVTYRGHINQNDDPTKNNTNMLSVADVAFQPGGKLIASVCGNQVHLWDPNSGKLVKVLVRLDKADKPLKSLAFNPLGKSLAIGSDDGIVRVYDVETGKLTFTGPNRPGRVERVAYSPNGKMIAAVDSGGNLAVFAPGAKTTLALSIPVTDGGGDALGVAFTADNGAVVTCGKDGKARLTAGPKPDGSNAGNASTKLRDYTGHTGAVLSMALSPDGKLLATGGQDLTVRLWDVATGKALRSFQGHTTKVVAVAIRPDGHQIASASEDGAIRLWDIGDTDDHRSMAEATDALWTMALSSDGKRLAAAGADKKIRIYNPDTGKLETELTGHTGAITALAFFPDNNQLVSVGGDRVVKIWDVAAKKLIRDLPGHESAILAVAVAPNGKFVISGSADRTLRAWDAESGKPLWVWTGKSAICAAEVRKGGKSAAIGSTDGSLIVLDISTGTPKQIFAQPAHIAGLACLAYSADGARAVTVGGDGAVCIWNVAEDGTFSRLHRFEGHLLAGTLSGFSQLSAAAFSPDGRFVATAGREGIIRIWDIQTRAEVHGVRGHTDWVTAVAFGPNGRLLASVGVDKTVRVFELSPQESSTTIGHSVRIRALAVSPNGKLAATASDDRTIKLWDIASGREIATLIGSENEPFALTFLGNGMVVMGGKSGRLQFWDIASGRQIKTVPTGEVDTLAASENGSRLAVWAARPGGDHRNSTYEIYDSTGTLLISIPDKGREVKAVVFSADLKWAVAGDKSGLVQFWDFTSKEAVAPMGAAIAKAKDPAGWSVFDSPIVDLGITADKKLLVAVNQPILPMRSPELKVADVAKRNVLGTAPVQKAGILGLVVSPTGTTCLTIGRDQELKLWSLADPTRIKEVRSWNMPIDVLAAAYTPDGKKVITANADGTAYVLELP